MNETLRQLPELPREARPIVVIGAGGIVENCHLPAYRLAGFHVHSLFDVRSERSAELARTFGVNNVPESLEDAVATAPEGAVFDIALPASAILPTLNALPQGSPVLIQKPMGETLAQAQAILDHCRRHRMVAAVNFQMRDAPYVRLAREMIDRGLIGHLLDIEVRVTTDTPWHLWTFLEDIPRMEILYHSIHYIDTIRAFCGEPSRVFARTVGHPRMPRIRQVRSALILDYGDTVRATITANHTHNFGPRHQESYIKWEGSQGAIKATMGLNLDYPHGRPDDFQYCLVAESGAGDWQSVPLQGSWFPHAFMGPMSNLMRFLEGSADSIPTAVEEAFKTMAVVEAAFISDSVGGEPVSVSAPEASESTPHHPSD